MDRDAIFEIVRHDPRYAVEAYEFMDQALCHTQKSVGADPQHHVSGPELLQGACDLAREEFGLMARVVFRQWGIHRTDDVGEIIFNLIEAEQLSKTDSDHRSDFQDVFDLDRALSEGFTIALNEVSWSKRGAR